MRRNAQYIVTSSVTQTHTCLGGLNGLPVVTRAFGSTERGESGVLPGRDLSTFVAGRTLTNLQHRVKNSVSVSCNQRKYKPKVPNGSVLNPVAYTAVCETAGLARSINTQPAVRRSEPSMSFAFNSSLLSVDGMTYLIPFES